MRKTTLLVLIGGLMVALAAPVLAMSVHEHKFKMYFTSHKPRSSTGMKFSTDRYKYTAPQPGQTANPVTKLTFTLQRGTKIKTSVLPACSKARLESIGKSVCAKSKVGTGNATVITGLAALDPVKEKVTLFAAKGGMLAFLEGLQNQVIELKVRGNKMTTSVPRVCLPPGTEAQNCPNGEAVLTVFSSTIKPKKTKKGALITTPSRCPKSKKWVNKVSYKFRNGDTETEKYRSRCTR